MTARFASGFAFAATALAVAAPATAASPRLSADPRAIAAPASVEPGLLDLGGGAFALIPRRVAADRPAPLLVLMHGAGGAAGSLMRRFARESEAHGIVLLGLQSRHETWDAILARRPRTGTATRTGAAPWAADPPRIDAALIALFARVPVDPARIGLAGFSDGASYALSIGLANPQLFTAVLAFSPGMLSLASPVRPGMPVYVAHGTGDLILAYRYTTREILPPLRAAGAAVTFRRFDGGHAIPRDVGEEGIAMFLRGR